MSNNRIGKKFTVAKTHRQNMGLCTGTCGQDLAHITLVDWRLNLHRLRGAHECHQSRSQKISINFGSKALLNLNGVK